MWRCKLGLQQWNKPVANLYRDLEVDILARTVLRRILAFDHSNAELPLANFSRH